MASKTGIFSYGQKKRKIGHSNFNMGFNSLTTDNLGQLKVKACLETLADDFWNIGHNTLTKVKPMVSPAMTRIHQNWYAFYVANHQVWEHWDDYITNGTEYGRVYGSNATNQKLDNPWKVPTVMAPDLMLPLKIANGFAIPVYRYHMTAANWNSVFPNFTFAQLSDSLHNYVAPQSDYDLFVNNRITDLVAIVLAYSNFKDIPYFEAYWNVDHVLFECYLNPDLFDLFIRNIGYKRVSPVSTDLDNGHDIDPIAGNADEFTVFSTFRLFSDSCSSDVSMSNSPFVLQKMIYPSSYNRLDLNYFHFSQRHDLDDYFASFEPQLDQSSLTHRYVGIDSRFFGKKYFFSYTGTDSQLVVYNYDYQPNPSARGWSINLTQAFGLSAGLRSDDEILDLMRSWPSYLGVSTVFDDAMLDQRSKYYLSTSVLTGSASLLNNNQLLFPQFQLNQNNRNSSIQTHYGDFLSDVVLPVTVYDTSFGSFQKYLFPHGLLQSPSCDSLGYYSLDWLIYLCKQVSILLDDFGLPVDALTVRNTLDYRYETFNCLPFFAYSNIWEYHFRNQVVSSPELDYSKTNGLLFIDSRRKAALDDVYHRPSQIPEIWEDYKDDFMQYPDNGWVIPFSYLPKNSLASMSVSSGGSPEFRHFMDGQHHYFNVQNYVDVFCLLTGSCLDHDVMFQTYRSYINHYRDSDGSLDYRTFASLYQNDFYLPNYYNGLLHQKYQNFNKDYFSSAMLDPMSGANQVELGDTINELRVNEAKQSWFEKIAQNRSVRKFMEAIFGITPNRENKQAVLLGSDHVDINIGEVIQTSQTDQTPQGTRSGLGSAKENGSLVHNHCNEHGFILILCSHTIESQYFQGIARHWLPKASYMDYPTIDFSHVGNESILQKELNYNVQANSQFALYNVKLPDLKIQTPSANYKRQVIERNFNGRQQYQGSGNPYLYHALSISGIYQLCRNQAQTAGTSLDNVWGYTPRWSYYKFNLDQLHGEMRNKLQDWQTFRKFFSQPILSHEFVNWELTADSDELNRIFAVTDDFVDDKFILDIFINATVNRALDYVCVPMSK